MKGDYWGAIDSYRNSRSDRPEQAAAVHFFISKAFFALSVPDSARVHGEAAVRLAPGNMHYATYLARLAHEMQDYGRAAELYGQANLAAPGRTDILYSQALEYVAANRPDEALAVYRRLLERDPSNERYLSQTLWLQVALKRYADAIATLRQLTRIVGPREKLQLALGELYEKTGQADEAVAVYREILRDDRKSVSAWASLIDHYIRKGTREEPIREFMAFDRQQSAGNGEAIDMARLFASRTEKDTLYAAPVQKMLKVLVQRHPRDSRVYVLKGAFEMRRAQPDSAVSSFERAVRLDAGNVNAWESLVMARLERGNHRQAFQTIARARRALPRQGFRLDVLEGNALMNSGSPAKAAALLERVVVSKQGPRQHELLIQANTSLALAYDQLGRKRRSMEVYGRVLDLDPHNTLAMNNLAYLYAQEGTMLQRGLYLAKNAVMLDPENPVFLDTLGWVLFRLGKFAEAREYLEKSVLSGGDEAEIYLHLGEVYEKLGEKAKSLEMKEKAKPAKGK